MRRSALSILLLALVVASCSDEGDELASEAQAAEAGEAGALPGEGSLDGAVSLPSATGDAAGSSPDTAEEQDANESPSEQDASSLRLDAGGLDGALVELVDAALDAAATKEDAGGADSGLDAGKDAGLDAGKDAGNAPGDSAIGGPEASVDAEIKLDAAVDNGPNTFGRVYNSFRSGCRNCHQEGAEYSLNLGTREAAYAELVGGPNKGAAEFIVCANKGLFRVIPYDPARSMLIQKLENKQTCGDRMPPNGSLSAAQIQEVRTWIALGALDN